MGEVVYQPKGMRQDESSINFNSSLSAFENKNIRINTTLDKTKFSLTNERGNKKSKLIDEEGNEVELIGTVIGEALINQYWILFTTSEDKDRIYRLEEFNEDTLKVKLLIEDKMNFDIEHPIETLTYYETDLILKVYWTDSINQPRMLNILDPSLNTDEWDINRIEVIPNVNTDVDVTISKRSTGGAWAPGTVQYFVTYVNKYGQESNIVYTSPLYYLTAGDKDAVGEDEIASVSFDIDVRNVDTRFKYVRIYSIHKPYQNAAPVIKLVSEIPYTEVDEYTYIKLEDESNPNDSLYTSEIRSIVGFDLNDNIENLRGRVIFKVKHNEWIDGSGNNHIELNENITVYEVDPDSSKILNTYKGDNIPQEVKEYIRDLGSEEGIDLCDIIEPLLTVIENPDYLEYDDSEITRTIGRSNIEGAWNTDEEENKLINDDDINLSIIQIQDKYYKINKGYLYANKKVNRIEIINDQYDEKEVIFITQIDKDPSTFFTDLCIKFKLIHEQSDENDQLNYNIVEYVKISLFNPPDKNNLDYGKFFASEYTFKHFTNVNYVDTNIYGEILEPTYLLYVGGVPMTAQTIAEKDGTLFLGNIKLLRSDISDELKTKIKSLCTSITQSNVRTINTPNDYFTINSLSKSNDFISHFKTGDIYRFGVQIQDITGKWSQPIFLTDYKIEKYPYYNSNNTHIYLPELTVRSDVKWALYKEGYVAIRPLVVHPNVLERNVICQGVVCPTLFNISDRKLGSIYSTYSWFARPKGGSIPNSHWKLLDDNTSFYPEIQSIEYKSFDSKDTSWKPNVVVTAPGISGAQINTSEQKNKFKAAFVVDESIFTVHSPEIEFEEMLKSYDLSNINFRIIGAVQQPEYRQTYHIEAGSPLTKEVDGVPKMAGGFTKSIKQGSGYTDIWNDFIAGSNSDIVNLLNKKHPTFDFRIYPWQGLGSLNNSTISSDPENAKLERKIFSNVTHFTSTKYFNVNNILNYDYDNLIDIKYIDYNSSTAILNNPFNNNTNIIYKGLLNNYSVIPGEGNQNYYNILVNFSNKGWVPIDLFQKDQSENIVFYPNKSYDDDPASRKRDGSLITYKCGPHIVTGFKIYSQNYEEILPQQRARSNYDNKINSNPFTAVYNDSIHGYINKSFGNEAISGNYLLLGEFYRADPENPFGGTSDYAISNNLWQVGGKSIIIEKEDLNYSSKLQWTYGDTYYQRYDCLRTMPYNENDINQVVDIMSFMCETRINLAGRYDKNILLDDYTHITGENFNLINQGYTQTPNYQTFRTLTQEQLKNVNFPNQFTWTTKKLANATVDAWSRITMASVYDMRGDLGQIRALRTVNDRLVAFQDNGIALINYNLNVPLNTESGIPVELGKSNRVEGVHQISNTIGCNNKWSIKLGQKGLYFIDGQSKNMYRYSLDGNIINISQEKGMHSWSLKNINNTVWNLKQDNNGFRTFLDLNNNDVLFVSNDTCIAFNEELDVYTSLYSYNGTKFMNLVGNNHYMIGSNNEIYKHNAGDYNIFYDNYYDFYTRVIVNKDPLQDKIFNNIEFRSDIYRNDEPIKYTSDDIPISYLEVSNEYQYGKIDFTESPKDLKRKFRIWRANIPRDQKNYIWGKPQDRIRNPWIDLTIGNVKNNTDRVTIHDISIKYT